MSGRGGAVQRCNLATQMRPKFFRINANATYFSHGLVISGFRKSPDPRPAEMLRAMPRQQLP